MMIPKVVFARLPSEPEHVELAPLERLPWCDVTLSVCLVHKNVWSSCLCIRLVLQQKIRDELNLNKPINIYTCLLEKFRISTF